jgi:hypothetical protein
MADPAQEIAEAARLARLVPYPVDEMTVWPISPRVNSPKNDDRIFWNR